MIASLLAWSAPFLVGQGVAPADGGTPLTAPYRAPFVAQQSAVARTALSEPAISPDDKEVAFIAGGDVWTVAASGGEARLLVAHPSTESRPLWSPDGTRIAFVSTRTGNGDIYILDLRTNRLVRRTFDDGREQLDSWSRDGRWLYYSSAAGDISGMQDVWRVPADGGQPAPVAADRYASEYWAAPSPDGRLLAITARGTTSGQWWRHGHSHLDESEIWLVDSLDAERPVYRPASSSTASTTTGKSTWPMWAPDGKTLYFMTDRNGQENLVAQAVGSDATRPLTTFSDGRVLWPQIAYNGRSIVFERNYGIWRYDFASNRATEIVVTLRGASADINAERTTTSQFASMTVSPDGRKVLLTARGDLYVAGARDGGDAARLTNSFGIEAEPAWLPDSRRVVYAALRGTAWNLFVIDAVTRVERALTTGTARNYGARVSPDGRFVAYQRDGGEVRVVGIDGSSDRRLAQAEVGEPPFGGATTLSWSPDSRWVAFDARGAGGFANVWVVGLEGAPPRQVSFGADANVGGVQWSPDGSFLLYRTAQRTETARIIRVDLKPRTPRFREDQYRDLFGPTPGTPTPGTPTPGTPRDSARTVGRAVADTSRTDSARTATPRPARTPVTITFEGIRLRASVLPTLGLEIGTLAISPDGKTLAMSASAGGQQQLYTQSLDELARDQQWRAVTTSPGGKSSLQWSPDSRELWYLDGGRISATGAESRQTRVIAASAETESSFEMEKRAMFDQARSYLANNFFDARMNGVAWDDLAARVSPYVEGSRNPDDLRRVLSLMIGELNASHLGISGPSTGGVTVPLARMGVRFDRRLLEREGRYRIAELIAQGPAQVAGVAVGDEIVAVDGTPLARGVVLDSLLMGKPGRRLQLSLRATPSAAVREVGLQPVTLGAEKGLLYRQWVEERRAYVAKASGGRLGYVHMFDMGQPSLDQLYLDLDAENQAREGVVIDVRNNNGGFVNAYAIDVFSRRSYLQFTPRGSVAAPARASLGQRTIERPTVLVVNQHTLSDGEDFTEGYRSLGLGKVVGEPTAGWIIFTSNVPLLDGSTLRIPFTRVTDAQGRDMEFRPRAADISVVRHIGESYAGIDRQLDTAVRTLLESLPKRP